MSGTETMASGRSETATREDVNACESLPRRVSLQDLRRRCLGLTERRKV